ncbi:MAG: type II toxin-antitoxin system RelE/ParE family toxin [Candidatus Omnitrophica bacterium]|nr:type II toxin-antitoxin system RelE/ParE family toxin [Candidatus Omnitrophota bacterium]
MYSVFYTSSAERQLNHLPSQIAASVTNTVRHLVENPRTIRTEKLTGSPNTYRIRIGRYRIVYTIEDHIRRVVIHRIAHRRDVYR